MFDVIKISFKASSSWKRKEHFPLKSTQIFQKNINFVTKCSPWCCLNSVHTIDSNTRETQLTATPEKKNNDAWLNIAYIKLHALKKKKKFKKSE